MLQALEKKNIEKTEEISVHVPLLSVCESECVEFCLGSRTKGPFSLLALEAEFPHCSHCSSRWMPFKGQIGVTKSPLLFKGVVATYIKYTDFLKPYPIPQKGYCSVT